MHNFWRALVVALALAGIIATAHADEIGTAKEQLASLSAEIDRVDTELAALEQ